MNPRRIRALISKEARELIRDPATIILCVLMPLVMLFLFGYAVNLDVEDVTFAVYDEDHTPASRELIDRFSATPYFKLTGAYDSIEALQRGLQHDDIEVGLIIPRHLHRDLIRGQPPSVQVLIDGTYPTVSALAGAYADAIIQAFPRPNPVLLRAEIRVWYNPSLRSSNYIVPGLFAVILMAFPPLLTALAIVREKETSTIQQIYASPVTSAEFIAGKLLPYGLVAFLQVLLVVAVGVLWFEIPFRGSLMLLLAVSGVYVLTTVAIGLLVSTVTRTQLAAMLLALIITLMPSFLFSGFLFPVFTMPFALQLYSQLFPATYFMEISRGVVLKGVSLESIWQPLLMLVIYTAVIFFFAASRLRQKVA